MNTNRTIQRWLMAVALALPALHASDAQAQTRGGDSRGAGIPHVGGPAYDHDRGHDADGRRPPHGARPAAQPGPVHVGQPAPTRGPVHVGHPGAQPGPVHVVPARPYVAAPVHVVSGPRHDAVLAGYDAQRAVDAALQASAGVSCPRVSAQLDAAHRSLARAEQAFARGHYASASAHYAAATHEAYAVHALAAAAREQARALAVRAERLDRQVTDTLAAARSAYDWSGAPGADVMADQAISLQQAARRQLRAGDVVGAIASLESAAAFAQSALTFATAQRPTPRRAGWVPSAPSGPGQCGTPPAWGI